MLILTYRSLLSLLLRDCELMSFYSSGILHSDIYPGFNFKELWYFVLNHLKQFIICDILSGQKKLLQKVRPVEM